MEILRVLPNEITSLAFNVSCNDLNLKSISSLLQIIGEFELKKLSLDFASTGIDQDTFEHFLDWFECSVLVEESLYLDLSV
jgi:hypothetical protein